MYHRYLPKGNGGFECQRVPQPPRQPSAPSKPQPAPPPQTSKPVKPPPAPPAQPAQSTFPAAGTPFSFLSGLDRGELLVVLILLLLLSEGGEDNAGMIMTLAIFLFLQ